MSTKKNAQLDFPAENSKEPEQFVFIVIDQQPTNYFREEDPENDGRNTRLSSGDRIIPRESYVRTTNADGQIVLRKTRHITGCPTFYVDEQEKQGYTPNYIEDMILFKKGRLVVRNSENGVSLANYLRFGCSANRDCKVRTDSYKPLFYELNIEEVSTNIEAGLDLDAQVMEYMSALKRKKSIGGGTVYNSDRLEFLANLFGLPAFDNGYGSSEAWVAITTKGKAEPAVFLDTIYKASLPIEQAVSQGLINGAIQLDSEKATLSDNKNTVLITLDKNETEDSAAEKLADFFLNPNNRGLFGTLQKLVTEKISAQTQVIQ